MGSNMPTFRCPWALTMLIKMQRHFSARSLSVSLPVMKLFRKSQDHPSPAVTAAVTMPCLKILQGLINPKDPTTSKNKASRDHKVVNVNIICRSLLCSYIHSLPHSPSYPLTHSLSLCLSSGQASSGCEPCGRSQWQDTSEGCRLATRETRHWLQQLEGPSSAKR